MNSENNKTSAPYRLLVNLADKIDIRKSDKYVILSNLSMYYIWKNINSYKKDKFKISCKIWSEKFNLLDGSSSDIQDYFVEKR